MRDKIDISKIEIGHVFAPARLEEILGVKAQKREYALRIMEFAAWLEREFRKSGKPYCVRTRQDAVVVLTQEEAAPYTCHRYSLAMKRARRSFRRAQAVPLAELSAPTRERHEQNLKDMALEQAAVREVRRARAAAHVNEHARAYD